MAAEGGGPEADPGLASAADRGETLAADLRLGAVAVLLALQILPPLRPAMLGLLAAALVLAVAIRMVVARGRPPVVGFLTSAADVSLVTLLLALGPAAGPAGHGVVFDLYFLAVALTALRWDWRVSAAAGLLAAVEYAALAARLGLPWQAATPRLALLAAAALLAAVVARRAHGLRRLSAGDRLTGLLNRGAFDERLAAEAVRSRRHGHPYTVAVVDIDHFKPFNDTLGHAAGDAALQRVAETLRQCVRRSDVLCRYGGEEFALLLPETRAEEAMGRLETIRKAIAATPVVPGSHAARVTVSVGVAGWPEDGESEVEVTATADRRLYQAKRTGRNRVVGARPPAIAKA